MRHSVTVTIALDEILDRVYAESAWRAAHAPEVYHLSEDNAAMITTRIGQGFDDLVARLQGYVAAANYNPNVDDESIVIVFQQAVEPADTLEPALTQVITSLLASYVLMCFYGDEGTSYGSAWRKYRAQTTLLLSHT